MLRHFWAPSVRSPCSYSPAGQSAPLLAVVRPTLPLCTPCRFLVGLSEFLRWFYVTVTHTNQGVDSCWQRPRAARTGDTVTAPSSGSTWPCSRPRPPPRASVAAPARSLFPRPSRCSRAAGALPGAVRRPPSLLPGQLLLTPGPVSSASPAARRRRAFPSSCCYGNASGVSLLNPTSVALFSLV